MDFLRTKLQSKKHLSQKIKYSFSAVPELQEKIISVKVVDNDNELFEKSLEIAPRKNMNKIALT